ETRSTDADGNTASSGDLSFTTATGGGGTTVLYRVNAGGSALTNTPNWSVDTKASPSPYVNAAATGNKTSSTSSSINLSDPSLSGIAPPITLFQTERYDPSASPEMQWFFPVVAGYSYEVRLYFAETYKNAQKIGGRKFDVTIEGILVLNDYDVFADVGANKGVMKSFTVSSDASLNINFGHVVENPAIKGIEILQMDGGSGGDTTPPVISAVQAASITDDSATINWTTNEASDSVVDYGTTSAYGSTGGDPALVTSHSVTLTGLNSDTLYHFEASSTDPSGNTASSGDLTFTTSPANGNPSELLNETFTRPDSGTVGNGWVETETGGASVTLSNGRLFFADTSDAVNRPMASRTFTRATAGLLEWRFTFDWTRTGNEGAYSLFMQLGDGSLMSINDQNAGVAVNLAWTKIGGNHQMLGYRDAGSTLPLEQISGAAEIIVQANLDTGLYDVSINGAAIQTGIPFDASAAIDTVRFFTDGLNEDNFSGRAFDNVLVVYLGDN
ncbi:MAG: malectin domain-containing carbohydrate-binding protein, partial [Gammaproteobacteria bacterium]